MSYRPFRSSVPIALALSAVTIGVTSLIAQDVPSAPGAQLTVGAYYYPWYRAAQRNEANSPSAEDLGWMSRALRGHLRPRQLPRLGVYDSQDERVIADHIAQSVRANISFWAVSWWGPGRRDDETFRRHILEHDQADELKYAILYESTGRLGSLDKPVYDHLVPDFDYLSQHYFNHPQYLRVDGKPVVFIYLSRVYFRNRGGGPLAELRARHPDVYLIGDEVFGPNYRQKDAQAWDAVTAYDVYGQSLQIHGATSAAIDRLAGNYARAKSVANRVGRAFVPAISPGYNDRAVRHGHSGRGRYFTDEADSPEGSVFRAMIREIAVPLSDPGVQRMVMITSFNEWYEDTQIEATAGATNTTDQDDSPSGNHYVDGNRYVDYGDLYLDILRQMTAP